MKCPNCQAEISEDDLFCPSCGTHSQVGGMKSTSGPEIKPKEEPKKKISFFERLKQKFSKKKTEVTPSKIEDTEKTKQEPSNDENSNQKIDSSESVESTESTNNQEGPKNSLIGLLFDNFSNMQENVESFHEETLDIHDKIEGRVAELNSKLKTLDKKIKSLDNLEKMINKHVNSTEKKLENLEKVQKEEKKNTKKVLTELLSIKNELKGVSKNNTYIAKNLEKDHSNIMEIRKNLRTQNTSFRKVFREFEKVKKKM